MVHSSTGDTPGTQKVIVPNNLDGRIDMTQGGLEGHETGQIDNPSQPDESVLVVNLVRRLMARGFEFRVSNNRLRVSPWKSLTNEERDALRAHRELVKRLVRMGLTHAGPTADDTAAPPVVTDAAPAPQPQLKPKEIDPELVALFNKDTRAADEHATKVMMRMVGRGVPRYFR
jgi:hypothetical protein